MAKNLNQIPTPASSILATDKMYISRSPFGLTDDRYIFGSSIIAQFPTLAWTVTTAATQAMAGNNGYISNRVSVINFTLPTTIAAGQIIRIVGFGAGGWILNQNTGQQIHFGDDEVTISTGTISSTQQHDCLDIICVVANLEFVVTNVIGDLTFT